MPASENKRTIGPQLSDDLVGILNVILGVAEELIATDKISRLALVERLEAISGSAVLSPRAKEIVAFMAQSFSAAL